MGEVIVSVVMIVAGLIIATFPIIKLIGWISDGGVEPAVAIFGILLYFGLLVSIMSAPSAGKIVLLLIILASAILMPFFGQVSDISQIKHMEDANFHRMANAVEQDPMNAAARMELARLLRKRGDLDLAIDHMEWTLGQFPRLGYRIKTELDTWKREKERVGVPQPIYCHRCMAENPWNATQCYECSAAFGTRAGIKQRVEMEGGPKRVIRGWVVTAAVLNVICFALIFLPKVVPIEVTGVVIIASVIVGAWLFLRWVGGDMGAVPE